MKITDTIKYVGVNDHQVDLFEGQYKVPNGMSYNSYVILDEKIAVMDTVGAQFGGEWMDRLTKELAGRSQAAVFPPSAPGDNGDLPHFLRKHREDLVRLLRVRVPQDQPVGDGFSLFSRHFSSSRARYSI